MEKKRKVNWIDVAFILGGLILALAGFAWAFPMGAAHKLAGWDRILATWVAWYWVFRLWVKI